MTKTVRTTRAMCPQCMQVLPAAIEVRDDKTVWMVRECPDHGRIETYIWPDGDHYEFLMGLAFPQVAPIGKTIPMKSACPTACGICTNHKRKVTLAEIEVTQRCNMHCPVCFMSADTDDDELTPEEFRPFYQAILDAAGGDTGVQITGGEPTVRKDLDDIIRIARQMGFWGVEVNTNGLVIAKNLEYLENLVTAGLTGIYLSFDGVTSEPYVEIKGMDVLAPKLAAVENCRRAGVQVVLCMTIVAGVNDDQVGAVIKYALENNDVVAGVALQPAFTSGRFDAEYKPLTSGDVIFSLEEQTDGLITKDDIWPLGCSHPMCDTGTYLVRHEDGFVPITRDLSREEYLSYYNPDSPNGSVFLDIATKKGMNPAGGLSIILMDYMDAATMDMERMEQCSMFSTMEDGRLIPFCSYTLSDCNGKRIHPPLGRAE